MKGRSPTPINYGPDGRTMLSNSKVICNKEGKDILSTEWSSPRCEACIRCLQDLGQQAVQKYLSDRKSRQIMRHESQQVPASLLDSLTPLDQARWIASLDQRCGDCETPLVQLKMEALAQAPPARHERASSAPSGGAARLALSRIPGPAAAPRRSDSLKGGEGLASSSQYNRQKGLYKNKPAPHYSPQSTGCYPAFGAVGQPQDSSAFKVANWSTGVRKSSSFNNSMFVSPNPGWNSSYDLQLNSSSQPVLLQHPVNTTPRSGSDFGISGIVTGDSPTGCSAFAAAAQQHYQHQQQQQYHQYPDQEGSGGDPRLSDLQYQPQPSASQLAAAASFFARAGQKMHSSAKKKRRSSQSSAAELAEGLQLKTRFSALIRTSCPPVPPNLLRPLAAGSNGSDGGGSGVCGGSLRPVGAVAMGKVKVIVRVRHLETGKGSDATSCIAVDQRKKQITLFEPSLLTGFTAPSQRRPGHTAPKMFALDAVFTEDDALTELCANALTDIVQSVVDGTDGCLFSFGHAKLGKTYTMIGEDSSPAQMGIMPCAIAWLFKVIEDQKERTGARFSVRVSAVEVHGKEERLTDLLAGVDPASDASTPGPTPGMYLRDDPICGGGGGNGGSQVLQSQSELRAPCGEKAALYLDAALAARSRPESEEEGRMSHLLFTLHVYQYRVEQSGNGRGVTGGRTRLYLLDLGSGRVSKEHTSTPAATSATVTITDTTITSSTAPSSALSLPGIASVLQALATGQRHIPHRESKLSQLLRDSMGSLTCRSCMIVQVSSNLQHYTESLQVVQLASKIQRLRRRKNRGGFSGSGGASSDDSSSCDSFGMRRAGRPRPQMGLLRTSALTSASEADYTSSSEQSCDTVIYLGGGGECTDGEGPPPLLLPPSSLQLMSSSGGVVFPRRRPSTPGSASDHSDGSQNAASSSSGRQLRSPLAGKKATPRTNALAWPRAAVKNAIETLSTQKEQWVDGPRAVYAEYDPSMADAELAASCSGQTDQISSTSTEQQQHLPTSALVAPLSSNLPPPLYSFSASGVPGPLVDAQSLSALTAGDSTAMRGNSSSQANRSHQFPASVLPSSQLQSSSTVVSSTSQDSLTAARPVTMDKETQSEEPYESESSPTTSTYSTLDRKNNRVLSDISERTEEVDTTPNDSERELHGGLHDDDDEDEDRLTNDVLDSIEPPPLLAASGTPTLDTSLCGTMGSANLLMNEDSTSAGIASALANTFGPPAAPNPHTSLATVVVVQTGARSGSTSLNSVEAQTSGETTASSAAPQLPTSLDGSSPTPPPQPAGQLIGSGTAVASTTTTTTTATTATNSAGHHQLPRVKHFVRDWVEKHSLLATTAVLGDDADEKEKPLTRQQHPLTTSTHSSPGHPTTHPLHHLPAGNTSGGGAATETARSTPRHHMGTTDPSSSAGARRHHRNTSSKSRDTVGVVVDPPAPPANQSAVSSLARVAQWIQSVNDETRTTPEEEVEEKNARSSGHHRHHHRFSQYRVPYQQQHQHQQQAGHHHHVGGSLDRKTQQYQHHYDSGTAVAPQPAPSEPINFPGGRSASSSESHHDRRGRSVPPNSVGSEHETEMQRVWYSAAAPAAHAAPIISAAHDRPSLCSRIPTPESHGSRSPSCRRPDGASNPHLNHEMAAPGGRRLPASPKLTVASHNRSASMGSSAAAAVDSNICVKPRTGSLLRGSGGFFSRSKPTASKDTTIDNNPPSVDVKKFTSTSAGTSSARKSSIPTAASAGAAQASASSSPRVTGHSLRSALGVGVGKKQRSSSGSPVSSGHSSGEGKLSRQGSHRSSSLIPGVVGEVGCSNAAAVVASAGATGTSSQQQQQQKGVGTGGKVDKKDKLGKEKGKLKDGKAKEAKSRLSSFLSSPLFGKKKVKDAAGKKTTPPVPSGGIRPPVFATVTSHPGKSKLVMVANCNNSPATTGSHKRSSSVGATAGSCVGGNTVGTSTTTTSATPELPVTAPLTAVAALVSPYSTVTPPRACGPASSGRASSDCSGMCPPGGCGGAVLPGGGGCSKGGGLLRSSCSSSHHHHGHGYHHHHTTRTAGCGHASSGYESMMRDSELSSHNDSMSESSVAGLALNSSSFSAGGQRGTAALPVTPASTQVSGPTDRSLIASVSSSKTKNNSRSSSSSSRRSYSAPPRSIGTSELEEAAVAATQSPASVRRLFPRVWSAGAAAAPGLTSQSSSSSTFAGAVDDPHHHPHPHSRRPDPVMDVVRQIRYEKIYDLLAQQDLLKQELVETRERLMIDPASWGFDLYVVEQMDPEDPGFLEALSKETEVLQKRVDASKSHVMMVTCFDAKGAKSTTSCGGITSMPALSESRYSLSSSLMASITGTTVVM